MGDQPIIQAGRNLWRAAGDSELGRFIRSIAETGGTTLEKTVTKGIATGSDAIKTDMIVLSDAVKKMTKKGGGSSGAPAQVFLPKGVEFPGRNVPPTTIKRRFPGLDEEGGMAPMGVILPPKGPKHPPLRAAETMVHAG